MKAWLKNNRGFVLFLLGMVLFRGAIADWQRIPTGSMLPTIQIGDHILLDRLAYDIHLPFSKTSMLKLADPERGDIVVFRSVAADKRLIKRVVAVPGDEVWMYNNRLFVNGESAVYQSHRSDTTSLPSHLFLETSADHQRVIRIQGVGLSNFDPVTVPAGHFMVLGDNRNASADSRVYGFVPRGEIMGRVERVLYSLNPEQYYMPRWSRFGESLLTGES